MGQAPRAVSRWPSALGPLPTHSEREADYGPAAYAIAAQLCGLGQGFLLVEAQLQSAALACSGDLQRTIDGCMAMTFGTVHVLQISPCFGGTDNQNAFAGQVF